jgi:tetratricopeptide (TPR) repeat protein
MVHEGWNHLRLQRPLAAWASWQRALRIDPDDRAAREALARLAAADDLPAAARATYRFRPPRGDARRKRWDEAFRGRDMEDLRVASDAFGALADADPADAPARYNQALCLAWLGENASAIGVLDDAVRAGAAENPEAAVEAWSLAEILRQGAGAEHLADDLSHTLTLEWLADEGDPVAWLSSFAELRPLSVPIDPISGRPAFPETRAFEWLDRPIPAPAAGLTANDLPRVRASVIAAPGSLRFSSPDRIAIEGVERDLRASLGDRDLPFDRRSTPLPLSLMDAAVWLFRLPEGLDEPTRHRLTRESVERYFEDRWIDVPHQALGDLDEIRSPSASPKQASLVGAEGSWYAGDRVVARIKLSAVVRVREQLAARPRASVLYCGYPFDRLRRRLGLDPVDPSTIDPTDVSCMGIAELDRLDPTALDDATLIEAYRSAGAWGDIVTTGRLAFALAERDPSTLTRPDLGWWLAVGSPYHHSYDEISTLIDRAIALDAEANGGRDRARLESLRDAVSRIFDSRPSKDGPRGVPAHTADEDSP